MTDTRNSPLRNLFLRSSECIVFLRLRMFTSCDRAPWRPNSVPDNLLGADYGPCCATSCLQTTFYCSIDTSGRFRFCNLNYLLSRKNVLTFFPQCTRKYRTVKRLTKMFVIMKTDTCSMYLVAYTAA